MCAVAGGFVAVEGSEPGVVVDAALISFHAKFPYELPKDACKTSCCDDPVPEVEVTITHWHDEP
jgi:hypothetical protein